MDTVKIDDHTEVKIEESDYGISLVAGFIGRENSFIVSTCKRVFKGVEKKCPLAISLGKDAAVAANALRVLADQIDGGRDAAGTVQDDDVPF